NTARSQFRAICQVLPLAFEIVCRPVDPRKIVEFLCIQGGPIPSWMASRLVDALGKAPGVGGKHWQNAWKKCIELQQGWIQRDEPELSNRGAEKIAAQKLERWQEWFAAPANAVPENSALDRMTQLEA